MENKMLERKERNEPTSNESKEDNSKDNSNERQSTKPAQTGMYRVPEKLTNLESFLCFAGVLTAFVLIFSRTWN